MAEALNKTISVQDIIDKLSKVTDNLATTKSNKNEKSIKEALDILKKAVCDLAKVVETNSVTNAENDSDGKLKEQVRQHSDEIDIQKQKNLLGKIVISSTKKGDTSSSIKSKETLKSEKVSLQAHVVQLTKDKYNLEISENDIETCFHLPKGGIMVSFWKKSRDSPFQKLASVIKTRTNVEKNLYFNFCLTKRRSELLFEIRKLKRNNLIDKFYSDEHGMISIKKLGSTSKDRITNIHSKESSYSKTWTVEELHQEIPPAQQ